MAPAPALVVLCLHSLVRLRQLVRPLPLGTQGFPASKKALNSDGHLEAKYWLHNLVWRLRFLGRAPQNLLRPLEVCIASSDETVALRSENPTCAACSVQMVTSSFHGPNLLVLPEGTLVMINRPAQTKKPSPHLMLHDRSCRHGFERGGRVIGRDQPGN
ncbi:hypothetical protein B0T22DRAFT_440444 [Podospora appendiculata]|uniref:Uncharacterized protein n=1 Tax=Podospora appendiculata TaxID=314037 RepID=A0AAE0XA67_9PEZI|nr:hypothetical protein B0T22DRAFT_440444 [Podospora appendiculata]